MGGVRATAVLMACAAGMALSAGSSPMTASARPVSGFDLPTDVLRIRPIVTVFDADPRPRSSAARAFADAAVLECDPNNTAAMRGAHITTAAADDATNCIVAKDPLSRIDSRLLLGPAGVIGTDLASTEVRRGSGKRRARIVMTVTPGRVSRLDAFIAATFHRPVALTLNGEVVAETIVQSGDATAGPTDGSFTLALVRRPTRTEASKLDISAYASHSETLREAIEAATLTPRARTLLASSSPAVDDKQRFAAACPLNEERNVLVFGCYGKTGLHVLRIDQPDLTGLMTVSLAHEVLHAAYTTLSDAERARIDAMLETAYASITDPHFRDLIAQYEQLEPGQRDNELHSLLATQITTLPTELETWYSKWFRRRQDVVSEYQVFASRYEPLVDQAHALEARYDDLKRQADSLDGQYRSAAGRAGSLTSQIDGLRAQGRVLESNALVGPQNAAVSTANSLARQYNGIVGEINSVVRQHAAVTANYRDLFNELSAVPLNEP